MGIREGTLIVGVRMIACACATSTPRQAASKSAAPTDEAQAPALTPLSDLRIIGLEAPYGAATARLTNFSRCILPSSEASSSWLIALSNWRRNMPPLASPMIEAW